jgi:hypothetical protein
MDTDVDDRLPAVRAQPLLPAGSLGVLFTVTQPVLGATFGASAAADLLLVISVKPKLDRSALTTGKSELVDIASRAGQRQEGRFEILRRVTVAHSVSHQ